jgi:hypothetical protein
VSERDLTATAEDLRDPLSAEACGCTDVDERLARRTSKHDRDAQLLARFGRIRGRPLDAA